MKKLAIVITHPIQYYIPWIIRLGKSSIAVKVFFTWEQARDGKVFDPGFDREIEWDIPLLEGYNFEFVKNTSTRPGTHHFSGLINPGLIPAIERYKPDALMVMGWSFNSHLKCLRYFHGKIPVLFRGDSVLLHESNLIKKSMRKLFLSWVYRHVDYGLYVGSHNKAYFLAHGLREDQLFFSPHAIDVDRFSEPDQTFREAAAAWKLSLGIPANHLTVLSAAKMTRVKNQVFLIHLAEACRQLPITFLVVGDGPLRADLEKQAAGNPAIRFLDFQNQLLMPVVYRLGDLFIMPSISETWGLGVNEAMASGTPVMASETVGCVTDLVTNNESGFTFPLDGVQVCRDFLTKVTENKRMLQDMSHRARSLIKLFTFQDIVTSIEELMATL